jgi:hypothetical protein
MGRCARAPTVRACAGASWCFRAPGAVSLGGRCRRSRVGAGGGRGGRSRVHAGGGRAATYGERAARTATARSPRARGSARPGSPVGSTEERRANDRLFTRARSAVAAQEWTARWSGRWRKRREEAHQCQGRCRPSFAIHCPYLGFPFIGSSNTAAALLACNGSAPRPVALLVLYPIGVEGSHGERRDPRDRPNSLTR